MGRPRKGQGPGAGESAPPPTSGQPAPAAGPAPKLCPSCGKTGDSFRGGKAFFCAEEGHVFDEHGQGRPADFADRVDYLWERRNQAARDPRVDNLDAIVRKLSPPLLGREASLDDVDADTIDTNEPGVKAKLALASGFIKSTMGSFFGKRRRETPSPAPAAALENKG